MTGRKNPDMTEGEKKHEYVMAQKRGYGDFVEGKEAEFLSHQGPVAEVAHERARWEKERMMEKMGPNASRSDDE